jgi:hypothetical protein
MPFLYQALSRQVLSRQVLYQLNHSPSPFPFSYFLDRILHFLPGLALDLDIPT